jgi:hypothetical protein
MPNEKLPKAHSRALAKGAVAFRVLALSYLPKVKDDTRV